jgi:hypothetical protein
MKIGRTSKEQISNEDQKRWASAHREVMFDCGEHCEDIIDMFLAGIGRDRVKTHTGNASGAVLVEVAS